MSGAAAGKEPRALGARLAGFLPAVALALLPLLLLLFFFLSCGFKI